MYICVCMYLFHFVFLFGSEAYYIKEKMFVHFLASIFVHLCIFIYIYIFIIS